MSYFSSLSQYNETKNAVAQHTADLEQAGKDAKAAASQKAFEGYSQLLETAGGNTTGLAGGFHVTRQLYKKYKTLKKAGQDAKDVLTKAKAAAEDALTKAKQGGTDALTKAKPDATDQDAFEGLKEGDFDDIMPPKNTGADAQGAKDADADAQDAKDAEDKEADEELGEPEEFEEGSTGTAEDVKGSDTFASQSDAPTDNTRSWDFNTQAADTVEDLKPSTTAPSVMEDDDLNSGFRVSNVNALDLEQGNFDMLSKAEGGQEPTQTTEASWRNPDNLGEEPDAEKTGVNQLEGDEPADEELGEPVDFKELNTQSGEGADTGGKAVEVAAEDQEKTGGFQPGAETTDADLTTAGSADRVEQGAQAFKNITPTPKGALGLDADAGDLLDVAKTGSSLLTSGLETAGTVLDFLGPVGEIVGAGIAIGGFFHSLFDSSEKKDVSADLAAPTYISQGGGISSQSLKTASQATNLVGTTY